MAKGVEIAKEWFLDIGDEFRRSVTDDGFTVYSNGDQQLSVASYGLVRDCNGNLVLGVYGGLRGFLEQVPRTSRYHLEASGKLIGAGISCQVDRGMFFDTQTIGPNDVISIAFTSQVDPGLEWILDLWSGLYNMSDQRLFSSIRIERQGA